MKYLITGGAGFIGSNIAKYLAQQGCFVRILDDFSSGKLENLAFANGLGKSKFQIIKGDIRDKKACEWACRGIDYVLHQAALRSVPESLANPESYNAVNIDGTLFMLQGALKNKVKRFVFASSSSIYGDTAIFPEREDHAPKLISPYALTKLAGEYYCRIFSEIYGLETVCLRYFNVFGPKQSLDDEYAVVVPKFIHSLLHGQPPPVFGNGKQSRDFTFIANVVYANILAATTLGIRHEVLNIATGQNQTVLNLHRLLSKIIKVRIKPKFLPKRPGDTFKTQADISKAKRIIKYRPFVSFEDGLGETVEYFHKLYCS